MSDHQTALAERDAAVARLETAQAQHATKMIESASRVHEHWDLVNSQGFNRDYGEERDWERASGLRMWRAFTTLHDREDGRFVPVYETELDLARMRAGNRRLAAFMSTTIGAGDGLTNHILGSEGPSFEVQASAGFEPPAELLATVQKVLDGFVDDNDFAGVVDRELMRRLQLEDGESFVAIEYCRVMNQIVVEFVEPDGITEPQGKRGLEDWAIQQGIIPDTPLSWSFGVVTQQRRTWAPLAYHVVRNQAATDWDLMPANRVERFKLNTSRSAKRGVSDLVGIEDDFQREAKLRANTAEGAAVQAAIAYIRQHAPGKGASDISAFVGNAATDQVTRSGSLGDKTRKVERMRPGTVKDIPNGMQYQAGPMGTLRSPVFIEVAAFLRRCIAVRWNMPEYMISSDASNNNFASSLVAESPFVKFCEARQGVVKRGFRNIAWKVLRLAWELNLRGLQRWTWGELLAIVDCRVHLPEVATRDMDAQTTRDQTLNTMGVKSKRTIATEHDLDYDEERAEIETEPAAPSPIGFESLDPEAGRRLLRDLREDYP